MIQRCLYTTTATTVQTRDTKILYKCIICLHYLYTMSVHHLWYGLSSSAGYGCLYILFLQNKEEKQMCNLLHSMIRFIMFSPRQQPNVSIKLHESLLDTV